MAQLRISVITFSPVYLHMYSYDPKFSDRYVLANGADPDQTARLQTAPRGAVWSGSLLFAIQFASSRGIRPW